MEACDVCGKKVKRLKIHKTMAHSASGNELVEVVAEILYNDVVKPLCGERGISVGEWEAIDHEDYLKVAEKILREVE